MGDGKTSSTAGSAAVLYPEHIRFSTKRTPTARKKWLIFVVITLFIALLVFLGLFIAFRAKYNEVKDSVAVPESVCQTFECLDTAAYIAKSMNTSVDPCEDFYQFACGSWRADHPIPADAGSVGTISILDDELLILDDPSAPEAVKQARAYFRSCEDVETIDNLGKKPLFDLLNLNGSGIYPTLQPSWTDTGMTFSDIVEYLENVGDLGANPFIALLVNQDERQTDKNIIRLHPTKLVLPTLNKYFGKRNTTELKLLENLYRQVLEALGANATTAAQDAKDVVDFEIQLAYAFAAKTQPSGATKLRTMTLAEITEKLPQFDWLRFVRHRFNRTGENFNITLAEVVANDAFEYFKNLFVLVNKSSKRTLLNYGVWRHVYSALPYLDKELCDLFENFKKVVYGSARLQERWKFCVQETNTHFPYAVGRLYVDKRFSPEDKQRMEQLIDSLIRTFRELLQENSWMTQPTKEEALKKLGFVTKKIGYPDLILNDTALNAESNMQKVDEKNFFGTSYDIAKKDKLLTIKMLRKPADRTAWFESPTSVNAYYHTLNNEIVFPAGIFNPPFYSRKLSDALIYGSIGFAIAHEITHGFDTSGSMFDEKGNLRQWWQYDDLKNYYNRTLCMVKQYSQFVDKELNKTVDGSLTIEENIADCGGIKEAFKAYRSVIKERGREDDKYPTLPYTQNQLFFIGFAQLWCGNVRPHLRAILMQRDKHSPNYFRVLGPIQNSEEFGQVFNCPVGTPMNPQKKCQVW